MQSVRRMENLKIMSYNKKLRHVSSDNHREQRNARNFFAVEGKTFELLSQTILL